MNKSVISVSLVTLLAVSVPAAADLPPSRDAGGKNVASQPAAKDEPAWKINKRRQALVQEGEALARQGQWAEAIERFQQALEIRSHPQTLLWIAFCEEQQGHLVRAQAAYTQARNDARDGKLKTEEGNATGALAKLEPRIPRLTIRVPADVEAKVWLDGQPVDTLADSVGCRSPLISVSYVLMPPASRSHRESAWGSALVGGGSRPARSAWISRPD
jgi:tetratricopeptide (TPR) repeat protein